MAELPTLERHFAALRDLVAWLDHEQIPYCVIGGVAASVVGRARATRDVDALVFLEADDWEGRLRSISNFGLKLRRPDAVEFAKRARVLLLHHPSTQMDIDVSLGALPFELEAVRRASSVTVHQVGIKMAAPEDLVVMKALPGRDRDWRDIEGILDANPGLDLRRARRHLRGLAEAIDSPDVAEQFEVFMARRRKRRKG